MTSVVPDLGDLVSMVASIRDRESLQLVSRVVEAELTVMEAQVAQLRQIQGVLKERLSGLK